MIDANTMRKSVIYNLKPVFSVNGKPSQKQRFQTDKQLLSREDRPHHHRSTRRIRGGRPKVTFSLFRSRIEHLPSHKKVDLSGKMQFIVVFQTM